MKPLLSAVPVVILFIVFGMILAVLGSVPAVEAAQVGMAVPLSGAQQAGTINVTGAEVMQNAAAASSNAADPLAAYPGLGEFASSNLNGIAEDVVGVYVRDIMALPVQQQPAGDPSFVASEHNLLTEFQMPKKYGGVGILAHNYLSGSRFSQLSAGTEIVLVFGDGRISRYKVSHTESYQALDPNSPVSDFVHPADPSRRVLSSADVFQRVYTQPDQVIFQTCFEAYGDPSWGRIFIVAEEIEPITLGVPELSLPGLN